MPLRFGVIRDKPLWLLRGRGSRRAGWEEKDTTTSNGNLSSVLDCLPSKYKALLQTLKIK